MNTHARQLTPHARRRSLAPTPTARDPTHARDS